MSASKNDYLKKDSSSKSQPAVEAEKEPAPVAIDGFKQVLEMLKIADPSFRESLLRRLAQRDRELANSLRRDLANLDL